LEIGLFPVIILHPVGMQCKLKPSLWSELLERHKAQSLRQLAKEYGVSHEAVRRALIAAAKSDEDRVTQLIT
jgi:hypothetical protein